MVTSWKCALAEKLNCPERLHFDQNVKLVFALPGSVDKSQVMLRVPSSKLPPSDIVEGLSKPAGTLQSTVTESACAWPVLDTSRVNLVRMLLLIYSGVRAKVRLGGVCAVKLAAAEFQLSDVSLE